MVPGGESHHSALAFGRGELEQRVECSADLERPGSLQILTFESHFHPRGTGQRAAFQQRSAVDIGSKARGGRSNVIESHRSEDICRIHGGSINSCKTKKFGGWGGDAGLHQRRPSAVNYLTGSGVRGIFFRDFFRATVIEGLEVWVMWRWVVRGL